VADTKETPREAVGTITVAGHRVGDRRRTGEILETLGEPGHEHYRVRWEDGSETVFYPSSDAVISRPSNG
jgi:hypothetical protein